MFTISKRLPALLVGFILCGCGPAEESGPSGFPPFASQVAQATEDDARGAEPPPRPTEETALLKSQEKRHMHGKPQATDVVEFPQSRCLAGVAEADITPPVGIYHRMWGAATHDKSTGVHRPLKATTLVLAPIDCQDVRREAAIFVAVDHCLLRPPEMEELLDRVSRQANVPANNVTVLFTHNHAAGLMGYDRQEEPGGHLIPAYLEMLAERISESITAALEDCRPANVTYGYGHSRLARNRDYYDKQAEEYVVGFNPDGVADPTVLVGRVTDAESGETRATIVNYACHPTTLGYENTLISPDFVGAMRELMEREYGAPCLFIQGASGDVGPREGFVADVSVADRNGRQLGFAALAALEDLPPPESRFQYTGPVVSGATLGTWDYLPIDAARKDQISTWQALSWNLDLPFRSDLPDREALLEERRHWLQQEQAAGDAGEAVEARNARAMIERANRSLVLVEHLPPGETFPFPLRVWRIGDAVWIALNGEHYNVLQRELRSRFPDHPLVIGTLANGSQVMYLPDRDSHGKGLYQEAVSVLAEGSLEQILDALTHEIEELLGE